MSTPAEIVSEPVIELERMDYDVPLATTEYLSRSTPFPSSWSEAVVAEPPGSELMDFDVPAATAQYLPRSTPFLSSWPEAIVAGPPGSELMDFHVPAATAEYLPRSTPSPSSPQAVAAEPPSGEAEVKQEDDELMDLAITVDKKRSDKIFFFKRMTDVGPRFDALVEVGRGELLPGSGDYQIEHGLWEVNDGLYVLRKTGPSFKVLQSVGTAQYEMAMSRHKTKHIFSLKTCAFLANRDASGQLHVLSLCLSGDRFKLADPSNTNVLHNPIWTRRVKEIAKLLGLKMGSPYDSHGKKATAEDVGDWAAGHTEKKLSAFLVYVLLRTYGHRTDTKRKLTLNDIRGLKKTLRGKGIAPRFEIHLTRAPCGTPKKPGKCVPFVQRISHLTGVDITIHFWENNVILDGTVPPRTKKKVSEYQGNANEHNDDGDDHASDSEEEDLQSHLAEKYPDDWGLIVRDGFEEVNEDESSPRQSSPLPQQHITSEAVRNFRKKISQKFKRTPDDITKPYPPTPEWEDVTIRANGKSHPEQASTSFYFEDETPSDIEECTPTQADLQLQHTRAAKTKATEARKEKKREARAKAAAAVIDVNANVNTVANPAAGSTPPGPSGASVIAGRLGGLLHSSQRIG